MTPKPTSSEFHVVKDRAEAALILSNGESPRGCFFVAGGSARHAGAERVGDLLNSGDGFLPFEIRDIRGPRTVLVNRSHIVMVALAENEASRDPGYSVATKRTVSLLLSSGQRVVGAVRVYQPEGRDRLSDWARGSEAFHYVETADVTLLVNAAHIIEISEVPAP